MTELSTAGETAFESLLRDRAVHVPVFEAYLGPVLSGPPENRANLEFRTPEDAIQAERDRLKGKVQRAEGSGDAEYVPLAGPIPGTRTERANDVQSITFTESVGSDGELAKVELQVHNVYDPRAQRYRYTDPADDAHPPLLDYGRLLALRIGYRDQVEFVFEGVITAYSVSFPAEGASMVSVTAVDRRDALRAFTPERPSSGRLRTEEEVIKSLVGQAGFYVARKDPQETEPAGRLRLPSDGDLGSYLKERAERVALELSCFGETIFALKPGDDAAEALVYKYRQGLLSFTPTFDGNGRRTRVIVRGRTPDGTVLTGRADVESLRSRGLTLPATAGESALLTISDRSIRDREVTIANVFVDDQGELDDLANALLKRDLDRLFTAEGEVLGDPRIRAGTSLRIEGVGRFTGLYYVTRATHEYGEGGYRTRFNMRRNTEASAPPAEEGDAA